MKRADELQKCWFDLTRWHQESTNELERVLQEQHNLTLNEFYALLCVAQSSTKHRSLQELQQFTGLSQSAMSRLISRMETKCCGIIKLQGYGGDRRNVFVSITENGMPLFEEAFLTFIETLDSLFQTSSINLPTQGR